MRPVRLLAIALVLTATSATHATPDFKGKSPSDYYRSLVSQPNGTWSTVLSGDRDIAGTKIRVSVKVYLFASGSFLAVYWQGTKAPSRFGGQGFDNTIEKFTQGRWSVSGTRLVLPGFGSALADGRGVSVTIDRQFGTVSMRGKPVGLRNVRTSAGHEVMRRVLRRDNITPQF